MTEKKFAISFNENTNQEDYCEGSILLAGLAKTFTASLTSFSKASYLKQWADAIRTAKHDRMFSALFTDVDLGTDGTGWLWFYTLIPSEDLEIYRPDEIKLENQPEKGIYITNSFYPVCTNPKSFLKRSYIEYEDGTKGDELTYYFLDLQHPERFFGYLDYKICGRSNWFVKNSDF